MLTARTKNGNQVCLGYDYKKETLLYLRNKEEFFCPICGESVSLKLGDQRIYHFAHKRGGNCREFYENESIYHMEGKRQLYQWLVRQKIPSILEFYDREIQQRPDIMFQYKGHKYALEYQCSTITEDIFLKRTNTYIENGYNPLWIIGSKQIQQKKRCIVSLSNFHYLFLRTTSDKTYYIPSYCPEKRHFQLAGSLIPYSIKNTFIQNSFYPVNRVEIDTLLNPMISDVFNLADWNMELEKFTLHWSIHPSPRHKAFLHEIYNQNLNLFLLPPEIGLPVSHSVLIQTSPIIWQTYVYLDVFAKKIPSDFISIQELEQSLIKRIKRKEVVTRNLPQLNCLNPFEAIYEYLIQLVKLGVLSKQSETIFQIQRNFYVPRSNREREEKKKLFYQKYHHTLSKQ